ncbi:MAG TPA: hypothetical protein VI732_01400, partial [Alphaproteobacteria bacterium]|nr:hypothetical protein [Alphaproteobacteria bacterium]
MRRLALVAVLAVLPAPAAADDAAVSRNLDLLLSQTAPDPALGRIGNVAELRRFYGARNGRPAWWRDGAWSPQAKAAITALQTADRDGLEARDYLGSDTAPLPGSNSEPAIARGDALLSAAMMRYIGDVRAGRVTPSTISPEYAVYPDRPDAATVLADGLGAADFGAWLLSLPPADSAYRQLR